jgi:hypothetical protein
MILYERYCFGGVLPHLDPRPSDYPRVAGAGLRLHPEELPEQDPMGLDPQKSFTEMYKDGSVENTFGVEVEVLDAVVPYEPLEEVARRERKLALREPREHQDLICILLHGVRIPDGGPPHVYFLLAKESTVQQGEQVFGLRLGLLPLAVWIWPRRGHRR